MKINGLTDQPLHVASGLYSIGPSQTSGEGTSNSSLQCKCCNYPRFKAVKISILAVRQFDRSQFFMNCAMSCLFMYVSQRSFEAAAIRWTDLTG